MANFGLIILAPLQQVFAEDVVQVDLQGADGDFGVLAGHAPIIAVLRPGILTASGDDFRERFVVLGGLAEFSGQTLTILADSASHIEDFDADEFQAGIDEMQEALAEIPPGEALEQALARLDHFRSVQASLNLITAL